ncbi:MAG: NAD(P)/FAD-dependent oxidoreductase [Lachnospiraceae bacterium]|nr:NAD(P)/FAD-dependent oxidoreductase [Lachnospiraceae bacterium]
MTKDIVIIGGGSAGIAAAVCAYNNGCRDILLLEKDAELGGILLQCIHNGFGLHRFKEELAGPAYAQKWVEMLDATDVEVKTSTTVIHLSADRLITYVNPREGYVTIKAKAVILATGCRERSRGAIATPGFRPSGVWTAGTAQKYINMHGYMVGRRVFILGSGDIGLIMARRMTLEGAKVLGVAEIMPYSNGLPRNIKQCLDDFDIPLYLSHTVTDIKGHDRLSSITISKVDENLNPIQGTETDFDVDTLLMSVGLIPDTALATEAGIKLHTKTKGAVVDEHMMTSVPGIFACGNGLHVHDLVDFVSLEGEEAGLSAAKYVKGELTHDKSLEITAGEGVSYVLPTYIDTKAMEDNTELKLRVGYNARNVRIVLSCGDRQIKEIKKLRIAPSEMEKFPISRDELNGCTQNLTISVKEQ